MAARVWNGGAGDWSDPSRWTTAVTGEPGAPQAGDAATIPGGEVDIVGAEGFEGSIYDGVALVLGDAANDATTLDLSSAFLGGFFPIRIAGSATIDADGLSAIAGKITDATPGTTLTLGGGGGAGAGEIVLARGSGVSVSGGASLAFAGTVRAGANITTASGSTVLNDGIVTTIGSLASIGGALAGTGTFDVADASTLALDGAVGAGQTIDFGDVDGRLNLAEPSAFAGAITGFRSGDALDLTTVAATSAAYDAASRTLTLADAAGATVATLSRVEAAAGTLTATSDGAGGTTVGYAGAPTRERQQIADGDRAMRSDVVRATMTVPGTSTPITGAGVKVGIISGSFDEHGTADAEAAAGYLPANPDGTSAVQVLAEGTGSDDEGREMAAEIHQVAPGAQLYFAASGGSQASFEASVRALTEAGCQIIADDVNFVSAPFYGVAGGLDGSVTDAIASGVSVFDSAGNFGRGSLEQRFAPKATTLADGTAAQAQIFGDGTPYEPFTVQANTAVRLDLQSTAPYEGTGTGAPQALTLKVFTPDGQPVATTTGSDVATVVDADGVPTTDLAFALPATADPATYEAVVTLNGGQASPQAFKMMLSEVGGTGTGAGGYFDDPEAGGGSGDERGIQLIPAVDSVGATFYGNSAALGGTPSFDESFVNVGPGSLHYDASGQPLSPPLSAGKLDFDAPDGVDVPNVQQSDPATMPTAFYGTSAASPNAAAVAALMLQADPDLTPAQITALLEGSAVSQGLTAAQQGAGLIQADRAVAAAIASSGPQVIGVGGVGETVTLQPSEVVFDRSRPGTTFAFAAGAGVDVIRGFRAGGPGHDTVTLPSADFANLAEVFRDTGDIGGSAFITDPLTGHAVRFAGVTTAELTAHPHDIVFGG